MSRTQPTEMDGGFTSARFWVNGVSFDLIRFGDYDSDDYPFTELDNYALDLCGHFSPLPGQQLNPSRSPTLDIANFLWVKGSRRVYADPTSKQISCRNQPKPLIILVNCDATLMLSPSQIICLSCTSGTYLRDDGACVSSCTGGSFTHEDTRHCHRNLLSLPAHVIMP